MDILKFFKKENASENVSENIPDEPKKKNKIQKIIVDSEEKNRLSERLYRYNIEHQFNFIGYGKYQLFYKYDDSERVETVLESYFSELIEENIYENEDFCDENKNYFDSNEENFSLKINFSEQNDIILSDKNEISEADLSKIEKIKPKKTRKKLGRNTEIRARFTDEEVALIDEKIKKSGLKKGEFVRKCLLEKEIFEINNEQIVSEIDALLQLKSEIGKVGGLLKSFIKPNMENYNVSAEDMKQVKKQLDELETLKKKIESEVKRKWQY